MSTCLRILPDPNRERPATDRVSGSQRSRRSSTAAASCSRGGTVGMIENDRYVLGGAGYLVEDLVHVTGAGPVVMTDVPRDPVLSG